MEFSMPLKGIKVKPIRMIHLLILFMALSIAFSTEGKAERSVRGTIEGKSVRILHYKRGQILVRFRPDTRVRGKSAPLRKSSRESEGRSISKDLFLMPLREGESVEEGISRYRTDPRVESAQPNYLYRACAFPNDTSFSSQWGLHNTGQLVNGMTGSSDADVDGPEGWDIETGDPSVIVAVIDTGVDYTHPDLANNIWQNPGEIQGNSLDDDGNGYVDDTIGYDFLDGDNDPMDPSGHGTHVAGIIAAEGNNGTGITGVGWTLKTMALKAGGASGFFLSSTLIEAINYAVNNGAKVINASWGGDMSDPAMRTAIDNAKTQGVLFIAAAGNSGRNIDSQPFYPASYTLTNIVSVAATDQDDGLASFSNFGPSSVDVGAPGTNILSTNVKRTVIFSDNFDDNDISDWTSGGSNDTWGTTIEKRNSTPRSLTDSPFSSYANDTLSWVRHTIDFTGMSGAVLTGVVRGISEDGPDSLTIQTSEDGSIWSSKKITLEINGSTSEMNSLTGSLDDSWHTFTVDIGNLDGKSGFFRFRIETDGQTVDDGWYIDDLKIEVSAQTSGNDLTFLQGTSFSAPYVSGLAGLLFSLNPDISPFQAREMIISGVDPISAFSGKSVSGGRVNTASSLSLPIPPDEVLVSGGGGCSVTDRKSPEFDGLAGAFIPCIVLVILYGAIRKKRQISVQSSEK